MRLVRLALLGLLLVLALGCPEAHEAPAAAPRADEFRSAAVDAQLDEVTTALERRGFRVEGETLRGFLVEHGGDVHELRARGDDCYVLAAASSTALRELSLRVHDAEGAEVARSEAGVSALRWCPSRSGTYYLALDARGAGLYAVGAFRGPSGVNFALDELVRR